MTETNFPTPPAPQAAPAKNYKNIAIGVLATALVAVSGYMLYSRNQTSQTLQQQETQIAKVTTEKSDLQNSFDASLARLDSMSTVNSGLESKLTEKNDEITKVKAEIRSILNKKNATASELGRAKTLIASRVITTPGLECSLWFHNRVHRHVQRPRSRSATRPRGPVRRVSKSA